MQFLTVSCLLAVLVALTHALPLVDDEMKTREALLTDSLMESNKTLTMVNDGDVIKSSEESSKVVVKAKRGDGIIKEEREMSEGVKGIKREQAILISIRDPIVIEAANTTTIKPIEGETTTLKMDETTTLKDELTTIAEVEQIKKEEEPLIVKVAKPVVINVEVTTTPIMSEEIVKKEREAIESTPTIIKKEINIDLHDALVDVTTTTLATATTLDVAKRSEDKTVLSKKEVDEEETEKEEESSSNHHELTSNDLEAAKVDDKRAMIADTKETKRDLAGLNLHIGKREPIVVREALVKEEAKMIDHEAKREMINTEAKRELFGLSAHIGRSVVADVKDETKPVERRDVPLNKFKFKREVIKTADVKL